MKKYSRKAAQKAGFSLLEILVVLGIMAILAGLGAGGSKGVRRWLAVNESQVLFHEIRNACRMYRMDHGRWPDSLTGREVDLNAAGPDWHAQLGRYLEQQVEGRTLTDGFGNTRIFLIIDADGDRWIERSQFEAAGGESLPERVRARVILYSLDENGKMEARSWNDEDE